VRLLFLELRQAAQTLALIAELEQALALERCRHHARQTLVLRRAGACSRA
jgi:hypothetical protein